MYAVTFGKGRLCPRRAPHDLGCVQGQAFGWEAVMTFVLVAVVYAVAIGKPSFTETGPIAVGFSLWASALIGEFSVPFHLDTTCKEAVAHLNTCQTVLDQATCYACISQHSCCCTASVKLRLLGGEQVHRELCYSGRIITPPCCSNPVLAAETI